MKVKIPDELIEQIYKGNAVLFVGSGLSTGAGLPTWPELVHEMRTWAEKHDVDLSDDKQEFAKLIKQKKYLVAAEDLRERMGEHRFKTFMHSVFRDDTKKPSSVHAILPEIPFAAVLTTNYDVLLESTYTQSRGITPCTYTYTDISEFVDLNRNNEFYILKIHGDIDHFGTVVVGRSDYRQLMFKNKAYRDFLKTLFMTRTILFVGFSLTDPDLLLLLDELGTTFKSYGGPHYALMSTKEAGPIEKNRWERDYEIQIISYEATEGHPEVYKTLLELSEKVSERVVSYALKQVRPGLHRNNFIVKGPNPRVRKLFVKKLVDIMHRETKRYSSVVVQVNMEEIPEQEFFQIIGKRLLQTINIMYPSIGDWSENDVIKDVLDFEEMVEDIASRIQNFSQQQIRIVLLLFNADVMNEFHREIKNGLRYILDALESTLTAIIVAQKLVTEDASEWRISPWFKAFLSVRLE